MTFIKEEDINWVIDGERASQEVLNRPLREAIDIINDAVDGISASGDVFEVTKDGSGFNNRDAILTFDAGTKTVKIGPKSGETTWNYFYRGEEVIVTGSLSYTLTGADHDKGNYISLDANGDLINSGEYPDIKNHTLCMFVHYSSTDNEFVIKGDERHGSDRDTQWHLSKHIEEGMVLRSLGDLTYTADDEDSVGFVFEDDIIVADEDLIHTIKHSASPTKPFQQTLKGSASSLVIQTLFVNGDKIAILGNKLPWTLDELKVNHVVGESVDPENPENPPVGAPSGEMLAVTDKNFVNYYIVATNCQKYPIKMIAGRSQFTDINSAAQEEISTFGLNFPEISVLYRVTLQKKDDAGNTGLCVISQIEEVQTKAIIKSAVNKSKSDHRKLSNRNAPDQHSIDSITGLRDVLISLGGDLDPDPDPGPGPGTGGDIGEGGGWGFGVGVYPGNSFTDVDLVPMAGHDDKFSENYGNYAHSNGSIFVFVPKFWYRTGSSESPKYGTYGANTIDIRSDFANTAAAGYRLHRAFIDGGEEKTGFFMGKYLASRVGTDARVIKNGKTISLTTSANYTRSQGMTGCVGQLHDALVLSKTFGEEYHCSTAFQYGALWLLSLYHGQMATSTVECSWYDAAGVTNFPKGCNDGSLKDVDDPTVTYTTAGDAASAKPLTGSASNPGKVSHNGQVNGIMDLNGSMFESAIGVTLPGVNATSTSAGVLTGNFLYVMKESTKASDLTNGFGTGNDAWGTETHLQTLYDKTDPVYNTRSGNYRWGNGNNAVFSDNVLDTVLPANDNSVTPAGTNQFGLDYIQTYDARQNMFLQVGGPWTYTTYAGLGFRHMSHFRSYAYNLSGFRPSAYGL